MADKVDDRTIDISDTKQEHDYLKGENVFIEDALYPKQGDVILDLGCGEGVTAALMAEMMGPTGQVTGADPDLETMKRAQETYNHLSNLSFVQGSSDRFPGFGEAKYDLILMNYVLHLVDKKEQLFLDLFSSLKSGGKIGIKYCHEMPELLQKSAKELNPENYQRIMEGIPIVSQEEVDKSCQKAGFKIVESEAFFYRMLFANMQDVLEMFSTMPLSKDTFDVKLVTKERLDNFVPPMQEDGKIVFAIPVSKLIAVKDYIVNVHQANVLLECTQS